MDACYRSAKSRAWEPVEMEWRGGTTPPDASRKASASVATDGATIPQERAIEMPQITPVLDSVNRLV